MNQKIEEIEGCLSTTIKKYEQEKIDIIQIARGNVDQVRKYADKLKEQIQKKEKEMTYIKVLVSIRVNDKGLIYRNWQIISSISVLTWKSSSKNP